MDRIPHRPIRRRFLKTITAMASVGALNGCTYALSRISQAQSASQVRPDLSYGPLKRHKLDLYLPAGSAADTPLVLFLYGGGWRWGNKERYGFVGHPLADRGLAVAIADYRLFPDVTFPAFNEDGARAAVWLWENRSALGLGGGPIHMAGHSAGAHIAVTLGLDNSYLEKAGSDRSIIGRIVGLAGPYAVYPSRLRGIRDIFPLSGPDEDKARPLSLADASAPPMLLLHGDGDGIVAARNSKEMAAAQTAAGGDAEARIYAGAGHREIIGAFAPLLEHLAPTLNDTAAFLKTA